jgi:hypothetical protein
MRWLETHLLPLCALCASVVILLLADLAPAQDCSTILTFETGLIPAREIHVATTGSNQTGNGSVAAPYATIAFAAAGATPGTAIRIHPGTYPGGTFLSNLAGTAQAPIWLGGLPGQPRPIIQGSTEALHLVKPRYLIVHDLEAAGNSGNGINADDGGEYANENAARFVIFRNLNIHDIGGSGNQDGLKLSGLNDYWVLDSTFARTGGAGSGSGIDHVGCHRGLIARCRLEQMSGNAVQCKGGSEDLEIRWCWMINGGLRAVNMGGSTGLEFFRPPLSTTIPNAEARNIRVVSNIIVGGNTPVAFVGCVDCLASNNTMVNPAQWLLRILQETTTSGGYTFLPSSGNTFQNNIVYFARGQISTYVNIGPNTSPQTFTFSNNLWYAYDNPVASTPTLPVTETAQLAGLDPRFLHSGTYAISASSPAAASGAMLPPDTGDIAGRCRPPTPARGAYEPCDTNCDGSALAPILNVADFTCFLQLFAAGDAYANCDNSTLPPVLNVADFTCFLQRFAAGCP